MARGGREGRGWEGWTGSRRVGIKTRKYQLWVLNRAERKGGCIKEEGGVWPFTSDFRVGIRWASPAHPSLPPGWPSNSASWKERLPSLRRPLARRRTKFRDCNLPWRRYARPRCLCRTCWVCLWTGFAMREGSPDSCLCELSRAKGWMQELMLDILLLSPLYVVYMQARAYSEVEGTFCCPLIFPYTYSNVSMFPFHRQVANRDYRG